MLDAVIIGAGFSGICLGKRLLDEGIVGFRIVDKAPKPGGTWYWNSYPGAACDVQSHFYSFSFEPNPDWSRKYSPWNEIQAYAEHCVDKYGLRPHIDHGKEVEQSRFVDSSGLAAPRWLLSPVPTPSLRQIASAARRPSSQAWMMMAGPRVTAPPA